jgi:hypothetical protein
MSRQPRGVQFVKRGNRGSRWLAALGNRAGLSLLAVGLVVAVILLVLPGARALSGLAGASALLGLLAYLATCAIYRWTPVVGDEPAQLKALRRLRAGIAEQLALHGESEALKRVLSEALRRLDQEMMPSAERLQERHALLGRDLGRFRSGEMPSPDDDRLAQLRALYERQERAADSLGRQVANAYASLVMLTQQTDDDARLTAEAKAWSNELLETHQNLADLLDEEAAFDRALEERSKQRGSN